MSATEELSAGLPADHSSDRLDSWKDIARYLQRDESTVQRWEKREGMPVHRHVHDKRGSVYAFTAELDAWLGSRRQALDQPTAVGAGEAGDETSQSTEAAVALPARRASWWMAAGIGLTAVLAGIAALTTVWQSPRSSTPSLVRLTSTTGLNTDPALSSDGSHLVYASDRGGDSLDLWVQPTTAEQPARITDAPGDEMEPSFSPDGSSIVFAKAQTGGIYVIGAGGGEPRLLVLTARAHSPRYSPDGRWVAYWTGLPEWSLSSFSNAAGAVFIVPATGGAPRPIAAHFADARHVVWSPDGESLLFLGQSVNDPRQSALDWYVARRDGGEPIRTGVIEALRTAGVSGMPIPGAWNRDGVTFSTDDEGAANVWRMAVSTETHRVAGTPTRLTFGTAIERSASASATGRVVFSSVVENVDIWRAPLDPSSGLAAGRLERVTDNAARERVGNVSDDDRTMAFISSRTGQEEIWLRDLATGQERQLTFAGSSNGHINHAATMLAVVRDGTGIDLVPAAGGPSSTVCENCINPDWWPGDSRLLFRRGLSQFVVRSLASGEDEELTTHPTWALNAERLSPDGRWVVFHTANSPSLRQVWIVPTFTRSLVPVENWIPVATDFGLQPSWSPNGDAIYYFSLRDGTFCAWRQPLDPQSKRPNGPPVAVHHFHQPRLRAVAGAMAANYVSKGYWYLTLTEMTANVWMLGGNR